MLFYGKPADRPPARTDTMTLILRPGSTRRVSLLASAATVCSYFWRLWLKYALTSLDRDLRYCNSILQPV